MRSGYSYRLECDQRGRVQAMISIQKNFLFVHIPKTGGNSIQNVLRDYSEDEITRNKRQDGLERFGVSNRQYNTRKHAKLFDYKNSIESEIYDSLFKFAGIRNPWERVISAYFSPGKNTVEWNRDTFLAVLNKKVRLRDALSETRPSKWERDAPMCGREIDSDVDFLIRFENLDEDFRTVCARLDIPYAPLPRRNVSKREHYSEYYDEELKDLVARRFRDEIDYGGVPV